MESLNFIKGSSDRTIKFKEKWIVYIDHGNDITENLATLNSRMEALCWCEEYLERNHNGYFYEGHKVFVKRIYKLKKINRKETNHEP